MAGPREATPLAIADPVDRTITLYLREGFGDGTDGQGHRLLDPKKLTDDLIREVLDGIIAIKNGEPMKTERLLMERD